MKQALRNTISLLTILFITTILHAQSHYCNNLSFEMGNFTNWTGATWIYCTNGRVASTAPIQGIIPGRQTIMTDTTAYDPNTGNKLKIIPAGYRYSAKLGDAVKGSLDESLSYTLQVDSLNALFIWKFAVVMQNPIGHTPEQQPHFNITVKDDKGYPIASCAQYDATASSDLPDYQTYYPPGYSSSDPNAPSAVVWRDWTTVGVNLLPYIGQNITITVTAADCTLTGHYGYGYFVAECHPLQITVNYCKGDSAAILKAPDGFQSYVWLPDSTQGQTLVIPNPKEGAQYTCSFTSALGCTASLTATIQRYLPTANFTSQMNCATNAVQFTNLSTSNRGTLNYAWDFGDGATSFDKNPSHIFATSGMHPVSLTVSNPPSGCQQTLSKLVESFDPQLIKIAGDTTFCKGESTTLTVSGAHSYRWSTGDTASSIQASKAGTYRVVGYSSIGCPSDTVNKHVIQEPDWPLTITGDSLFCAGDSTQLTASGGIAYVWNTGATTASITVHNGDTYSVIAQNPRGCQQTVHFNTIKDPLPSADFTLSKQRISLRNNIIQATIPTQDGVTYQWDFGDGTTATGASVEHTYTITSSVNVLTVALKATNRHGCSSSTTQTIYVDLFVPNVFTPNNDGVNDVFMKSYDLKIFDRSGIELYNGTNGWDGTYKGVNAPPDTYFYILHYEDINHRVEEKQGYVTLLR